MHLKVFHDHVVSHAISLVIVFPVIHPASLRLLEIAVQVNSIANNNEEGNVLTDRGE